MSADKLERIEELVNDIHRRLFYDNGSPSFQTRLSNHDQQLKLIYWFGGTAISAVIVAVITLWVRG